MTARIGVIQQSEAAKAEKMLALARDFEDDFIPIKWVERGRIEASIVPDDLDARNKISSDPLVCLLLLVHPLVYEDAAILPESSFQEYRKGHMGTVLFRLREDRES